MTIACRRERLDDQAPPRQQWKRAYKRVIGTLLGKSAEIGALRAVASPPARGIVHPPALC
jgi:hypothetical protein